MKIEVVRCIKCRVECERIIERTSGICNSCAIPDAPKPNQRPKPVWVEPRRREKPKRKFDYYKYLRSRKWRAKAEAAKKRAGYACQKCGKRVPLTVHHWTYARLGRELPEDLSALCWPCHQEVQREPKEPVVAKPMKKKRFKRG